MYQIKLVVNSYERWITGLHYEYFCPIEVDKKYYRKFLQKNFPYELSDTHDLTPYTHKLPTLKWTRLDERLQKDCMRAVKSESFKQPSMVFNNLCLGEFNEKDLRKVEYYNSLAMARHNAGLDYGIVPNYTYNYDQYLRPTQDITAHVSYNKIGGIFNLELNSSDDDDYLYEWLLTNQMKQGKLVFYDGDGDQAFKIEFWDCFCVSVGEQMTSTGSTAMKMNVSLSPAITRNRSEEHQKTWKITDITPSSNAFGPGPVEEEPVQEPEWVESYITDVQGKRIDDYQIGDTIIVVFKTRHLVGKKISLNLDDKDADFEYNGNRLENDILSNYLVNNNTEQVELTVIEQA